MVADGAVAVPGCSQKLRQGQLLGLGWLGLGLGLNAGDKFIHIKAQVFLFGKTYRRAGGLVNHRQHVDLSSLVHLIEEGAPAVRKPRVQKLRDSLRDLPTVTTEIIPRDGV